MSVAAEHPPLREVPRTRQHPGEPVRRWFSCPSADLYVWSDDDRIVAFELCYDKSVDEHSLRWREGVGFVHTRIDDGEGTPFDSQTPIAVPDGHYDLAFIATVFGRVAEEVEPGIRAFVLDALQPRARA